MKKAPKETKMTMYVALSNRFLQTNMRGEPMLYCSKRKAEEGGFQSLKATVTIHGAFRRFRERDRKTCMD